MKLPNKVLIAFGLPLMLLGALESDVNESLGMFLFAAGLIMLLAGVLL